MMDEAIERARSSGICMDPENCMVRECPCKYDINRLLDDNSLLQ